MTVLKYIELYHICLLDELVTIFVTSHGLYYRMIDLLSMQTLVLYVK